SCLIPSSTEGARSATLAVESIPFGVGNDGTLARQYNQLHHNTQRKLFFPVPLLVYAHQHGRLLSPAAGLLPEEAAMRFMCLAASALFASGLLAAPGPAADNASNLVVHEWGTFSTFSGSNGKNLVFQPYDDDLPDFTHGYRPRNSKEGPAGGSISLETPVLYFYTERPLIAWVRAHFPTAKLTQRFPHAAWTENRLGWRDVKVIPHEEVQLPTERKRSRYYAARETDATPLQTTFRNDEGKKGTEEEKFLFYRGVGTFELPLTVRA